jgi:translation initiation factor IF-2
VAKTRIHDLAAEFNVPTDQLLKLLAEMDIHVRSHLSGLDTGQVALVRARWEREKRQRAEPATTRRRRTTKKKTTKTKRAKAVEKPAPPARPVRRRRTAAEVEAKAEEAAAAELQRAEEQAEEVEIMAPDAAEVPASFEERAAALFGEPVEAAAEPTLAVEATAAPPPPAEPPTQTEEAAAPPEPEAERPAAVQPPSEPAPGMRPTPVTSGLRPVASAAPKAGSMRRPMSARPAPPPPGPRPIASARPGGAPADARRDSGKKRKKTKRTQVDVQAVQANINRTLASLRGSGSKKSARRRGEEPSFREQQEQRAAEEREREKTLVRVNEFVTVSELAGTLNNAPTEIVSFCFKNLGQMVTVNQRLDFDQIELIASEFDYEAVREEEYKSAVAEVSDDKPEDLVTRPPVVTVMGHVDHGKTSLLDHIRKSNVIAGEAGGITQHIGAYHVEVAEGRGLTFLDTPGHEAFTAMRARGAQITDIVVLVVAADDQVMPQTIEAISHAKNAGVPIVVAINKIDLPSAQIDKVKQDLLQHEVVLEEFGGETLSQPLSAKTGKGIEELLEKILLQADVLDKKANPDREASGSVVESSLDPGKGPVATVLIQRGTLKLGDNFICGNLSGRVRAMFDERGGKVKEAGPSIPVQVLGFDGVPVAGDAFGVVATANEAREIAQKRQRLDREASHRRTSRGVTLDTLSQQLDAGKVRALNLIIKADQGGPAEALADAFAHLSTDEVKVEVIHRGIGAITESDVLFAKTSQAIIIGFHVRPDANARTAVEREGVDVRMYRVIYEAVEDVRLALEGLLAPEERETVHGDAEILQLFKISRLGTIAGCIVRNGTIKRNAKIRVTRDGTQIYDGQFSSLKRFKEDVREVKEGLECGLSVENFNDIKVGDVVETYSVEQIARKLEPAGASRTE